MQIGIQLDLPLKIQKAHLHLCVSILKTMKQFQDFCCFFFPRMGQDYNTGFSLEYTEEDVRYV